MADSGESLVPVDSRVVLFYGDELQGVVVMPTASERVVYVPVRPLCDYLGLSWSGQYERLKRDPVLSEVMRSVRVTRTEPGRSEELQEVDVARDLICLPLDYLNGWLFSINATRVKEEVRERLIRYQRECYQVLANAFQGREYWRQADALGQVEELGRALVTLAREQREFNRQIGGMREELGALASRLVVVEEKVTPGQPVSDEQAAQISQAVRAIAHVLSSQTKRNEYGAVYGELYRRFAITSYKLLPATRYAEALEFLRSWWVEVSGADSVPF